MKLLAIEVDSSLQEKRHHTYEERHSLGVQFAAALPCSSQFLPPHSAKTKVVAVQMAPRVLLGVEPSMARISMLSTLMILLNRATF